MEKPRLTRPWLESLSTVELSGVAASWGLDVPEGLERSFVIEELLELALEEEGGGHGRPLILGPEIPEPAPLPLQYNITWLDVLVRDPLWAFAFWEIKTADREAVEKLPLFEGYCLKVFPVREGEKTGEAAGGPDPCGPIPGNPVPGSAAYLINVGIEDDSRYLGFPPEASRGGQSWYRLELCAAVDGQEMPLASSGPFRLPPCLPPQHAVPEAGTENRLRVLSGLDDLPVLRNADYRYRCPVTGMSIYGSMNIRPALADAATGVTVAGVTVTGVFGGGGEFQDIQ